MKQIRKFNTVNERNAAYLANPNIETVSYVVADNSVRRRRASDSLGEGSLQVTVDLESDVSWGQEITIGSTFTNTGIVTLENLTLMCELTGDVWPAESIIPGANISSTCTHTVDENDILAGKVDIGFSVSADASTGPSYSMRWTHSVTTEEPNGHLSAVITTSSLESEYSSAGENFNFVVSVINDGNLTMNNCVISIYKNEDYTSALIRRNVGTLTQTQESETIHFTYTTTEADVLAGEVALTAFADAASPDPENPDANSEPSTIVITYVGS